MMIADCSSNISFIWWPGIRCSRTEGRLRRTVSCSAIPWYFLPLCRGPAIWNEAFSQLLSFSLYPIPSSTDLLSCSGVANLDPPSQRLLQFGIDFATYIHPLSTDTFFLHPSYVYPQTSRA